MIRVMHLDEIRVDADTQSRAELSQETIAEYEQLIRDGVTLPPMVVFTADERQFWLADGFHRYFAYIASDNLDVDVQIELGDRSDAIAYSAAANAKHGLRRNDADKRRSVEMLLADKKWSKRSDRQLAEMAHVSHSFVGTVRHSFKKSKAGRPGKRIGADGRRYPAAQAMAKDDGDWTDPVPAGMDGADGKVERVQGEDRTTPPAPICDRLGAEITDPLIASAFEHANDLLDMAKQVAAIRKAAKELATKPVGAYLHTQQVESALKDAERTIKMAAPHALCPDSVATTNDRYQKIGWLTEDQWRRLVESKKKAVLEGGE